MNPTPNDELNTCPEVSVIITTFNSASCIRPCVESVLAQEGARFEIIAVDNASEDKTREVLNGLKVQLIANARNVGFGSATNQGFAASRGQFVYVLNPDTQLLERNALAILCHEMKEHKSWGLAGTRVVSPDGHDESGPPTTYPGEFVARNEFNKLPGRIAWVIGASMFFRREVYMELEGFDPGFFLYSEETDLCLRLRKLGHEIGYVEKVTVRHIGGVSEKGRDPYDVCKRKMTGLQRFWQKHYAANDAARLVRHDLYRARFRMLWYGARARFAPPASEAWRKHRFYRAAWEVSRDYFRRLKEQK